MIADKTCYDSCDSYDIVSASMKYIYPRVYIPRLSPSHSGNCHSVSTASPCYLSITPYLIYRNTTTQHRTTVSQISYQPPLFPLSPPPPPPPSSSLLLTPPPPSSSSSCVCVARPRSASTSLNTFAWNKSSSLLLLLSLPPPSPARSLSLCYVLSCLRSPSFSLPSFLIITQPESRQRT